MSRGFERLGRPKGGHNYVELKGVSLINSRGGPGGSQLPSLKGRLQEAQEPPKRAGGERALCRPQGEADQAEAGHLTGLERGVLGSQRKGGGEVRCKAV